MKRHHFRKELEDAFEFLTKVNQYGPPNTRGAGDSPHDGTDEFYVRMQAGVIVEDLRRHACRFGYDEIGQEVAEIDPRQALVLVGKMLVWMDRQERSPTIDVRELARLLGCTERTIWRHEGKGLIPEARRLGGVVRWDRTEIEEWMENQMARN